MTPNPSLDLKGFGDSDKIRAIGDSENSSQTDRFPAPLLT